MPYESITASFRTDLHARWSVFLDHLEIPWVYEPQTFVGNDGSPFTPAFWLPRQRIWLDAETDESTYMEGAYLGWWRRFAAAAGGWDYDAEADQDLHPLEWTEAVEVPEEWSGTALLALGPIPSDEYGAAHDNLWHRYEGHGMYSYDDHGYQWAICPACGEFGAAPFGWSSDLPCACDPGGLDDTGPARVDDRLPTAYEAARWAVIGVADTTGCGPGADRNRVGHRAVRTALIPLAGAAEAQRRCVAQCRSVADVLRDELPSDAYLESDEGQDLCDACPGFVCVDCAVRPAPAPGASCRVCEPVSLLTADRARERLNVMAVALGRRHKEPLRVIHPVINRAMGVSRRSQASLAQLAVGLTAAEAWIADPDSFVIPLPTLSEEEICALSVDEARTELARRVGTLSRVVGEPIPFVQIRLNDVMGVRARGDADDEQLREGLRQLQLWLAKPASYRDAPPQQPTQAPERPWVPGQLPSPVATVPAKHASSCSLCTDPVPTGALIGRLPKPSRGDDFGWLCEHCLTHRRRAPRHTDLLLRIYHLTYLGEGIRFNQYESATLVAWIHHTSGASNSLPVPDAVEEALERLRSAAQESRGTALTHAHGEAIVNYLLQPATAGTGEPGERMILQAVAQHLDEWRTTTPPDRNDSGWWSRREILRATPQPTVLSRLGGPYAL